MGKILSEVLLGMLCINNWMRYSPRQQLLLLYTKVFDNAEAGGSKVGHNLPPDGCKSCWNGGKG